MDGIINVYKEKGYSSFDVVARVRGISKQKRVGHTGTLDPAAEGVLPIALGTATRIVEMLEDRKKTYRTKLALGVSTDTQDFCGKIVKTTACTASDEEIKSAIMSFEGGYDQLPPMYSACQKDGRRLYSFARSGQTVERETRFVEIPEIVVGEIKEEDVLFTEQNDVFNRKDKIKNRQEEARMLGVSGELLGLRGEHAEIQESSSSCNTPEGCTAVSENATLLHVKTVEITITCSKGTYIRTICNDIGEKLGCGGAMMDLLRTETAGFTIETSHTLAELQQIAADGRLEEIIVPSDRLMDFPRLHIKPTAVTALENGNVIFISSIVERMRYKPGAEYLMCGPDDKFYGVYTFEADKRRFRPRKMFI